MRVVLLSTFLIGSLIAGCRPPSEPPPDISGPYFKVYDQAISFYYKAPRRPEKALALLAAACNGLQEEQALSCYNLGLLRELELDSKGALEAYRKAARLKPHPLFRAAVQSLDPDPEAFRTDYLKKTAAMTSSCSQGKPHIALQAMKALIDQESGNKPNNARERLPRAFFEQPFLADCLGKFPEYKLLLARIPDGRNPDFRNRFFRFFARQHPFFSLWDIELHLRSLSPKHSKKSDHPVTLAWRNVLDSASKNDAPKTAAQLKIFFEELDNLKPPKGKPLADRNRKTLALRRAAALLLDQDDFFASVRTHPDIQKFIKL